MSAENSRLCGFELGKINKSRLLNVKIVFSKLVYETSGIFIFRLTFEESEAGTTDIVASDMLKPS